MDVGTELASLDFGVDFDETNILQGLATPSPSGSSHNGLNDEEQEKQEAEASTAENVHLNHKSNNHQQLALELPAALSPTHQVQELAAATASNYRPQTTETCFSGLPGHPAHDAASHSHNPPNIPVIVNAPIPILLPPFSELNSTNHVVLGQNNTANVSLISGRNYPHYSSSFPSLLQQNPAQAAMAMPQSSVLFPYQNRNVTTSGAWNTRGAQRNHFSSPNNAYASNYMKLQQPTNLLSQISHTYGMQNIFRPQHSIQPLYPTYPMLEPNSYVQSDIVSTPPPHYEYDHQNGYISWSRRPALPSRPYVFQNSPTQTRPSAITFNSFVSESSVSPRYSLFSNYQESYEYLSQITLQIGFGRAHSAYFTESVSVSDSITFHSSQLMNSEQYIQNQSSTLHQLLSSKLPQFSYTPTLPQPLGVPRMQLDEEIITTFNENTKPLAPTFSITPTDSHLVQIMNGENHEHKLPCNDRIRKRIEIGESSSSSKRPKSENSNETERQRGGTSNFQDVDLASESERLEYQHAETTNPPAARPPRNFVYDPEFERRGLPIDPHIRLFRG